MDKAVLLPEKQYLAPPPYIKCGNDGEHGLPRAHPSRGALPSQNHHEEVELLLTCAKSSHIATLLMMGIFFIALQKKKP
jgi:hypothetical protein